MKWSTQTVKALVTNLVDLEKELRFLLYLYFTTVAGPDAHIGEILESNHPIALKYRRVITRREQCGNDIHQVIESLP